MSIALLSSLLVLAFASNLGAQTPIYQGKTITIVQGRDPGGTGDMRIRAVELFLQKHIAGNPTIVSEFMPGGAVAVAVLGEKACLVRSMNRSLEIPRDPEVAHIFKMLVAAGPMPSR